MLTFIELLIGVVVIVGVARYIIKGYSATGVLWKVRISRSFLPKLTR